jgi:hydrogenase-4 component F
VFRSEFQIVAGGFARPQYVGVTLLLVFVNLAFFGLLWHAGRMVLTPSEPLAESGPQARPGEVSAWLVIGMLGCLFAVVALGVHVPGDLAALLHSANHQLAAPGQ